MARGTDFGGIHSDRDLHLIQQSVDVQPATPKLNIIDVAGADGSKDLSTQPAGRVVYKDRKISWTFALYPGQDWHQTHRKVSGALNGLYCHITLDSDPGYYYQGRLEVNKYNIDNQLRQITINATVRPYMLKQAETTVSAAGLTTTYKQIILHNDRKPAVPYITLDTESTVRWGGNTFTLSAGTHKVLDIELAEGINTIDVKTTTGTGSVSFRYQEGAL